MYHNNFETFQYLFVYASHINNYCRISLVYILSTTTYTCRVLCCAWIVWRKTSHCIRKHLHVTNIHASWWASCGAAHVNLGWTWPSDRRRAFFLNFIQIGTTFFLRTFRGEHDYWPTRGRPWTARRKSST